MGKRKSAAPPPKKEQAKLETSFNCPFCNSSKSVSATLDMEREVGTVACSVCGKKFSTKANNLTEAIDIYSDWIDACEAAN
jgi:transcription elongation factor Elf1